MDDLIYILLGVVWIAIAFYRQSQKKKAKPPQTPYQETDNTEEDQAQVRTLLEEIMMGKQPEPVYEPFDNEIIEEEYIQDFEPVSSKNTFEEEYDRLGFESIEENRLESRLKKTEMDRTSPVFEDQISDTNKVRKNAFEFDWQKAVIYSEILNRPEF